MHQKQLGDWVAPDLWAANSDRALFLGLEPEVKQGIIYRLVPHHLPLALTRIFAVDVSDDLGVEMLLSCTRDDVFIGFIYSVAVYPVNCALDVLCPLGHHISVAVACLVIFISVRVAGEGNKCEVRNRVVDNIGYISAADVLASVVATTGVNFVDVQPDGTAINNLADPNVLRARKG